MADQKGFSKRFRYPLYYIIFFTICLLFCGPLSLYMILENIQLTPAFIMLGFALILLYMLYEMTQTILIDQDGIALDSLFGELRRFSWSEIQGIKPGNAIFSPGFKVYNHNGDAIEISAMLGQYDVLLERIRRAQAAVVNKHLTTLPQKTDTPVNSDPTTDFTFRASKNHRTALIVLIVLFAPVFIGSLIYSQWKSALFLVGLLIIIMPVGIYRYLRTPILVATRGEYLYIKYRKEWKRGNIRVKAVDVREVSLNHHRTLTPQGGVYAGTDVVLYLWEKTKIDLSAIGSSHEDLYLRLSAWLEKYSSLEPKEQERANEMFS